MSLRSSAGGSYTHLRQLHVITDQPVVEADLLSSTHDRYSLVLGRDGVLEDCPHPRGQLEDKNLWLWHWPWPRTPLATCSACAVPIACLKSVFVRTRMWRSNDSFRVMYPLLERVFCVTASSAPVERVFRQSGLMMKPNRSRLSKTLLSQLVFLKCNSHL